MAEERIMTADVVGMAYVCCVFGLFEERRNDNRLQCLHVRSSIYVSTTDLASPCGTATSFTERVKRG